MIKRYKTQIERRKIHIRKKLVGSKQRPRLTVYRSSKGIYAQLIDDASKKSLVSVNWKDVIKGEAKKPTKTEVAAKLGELLAQRAKQHKITTVIFDRSGYKYHGRVKAVADGARKGGLIF